MKKPGHTLLWLGTLFFLFSCGPQPTETTELNTDAGAHTEESTADAGTNQYTKEPLPPNPQEFPPAIAKAAEEAGMSFYRGNEPPFVEGYYTSKGEVVASKSGREPGTKINSFAFLTNQKPDYTIQYQGGRGWITGDGIKFTIYNYIDNSSDCGPVSVVISGVKVGRELQVDVLTYYYNLSKCSNKVWEKHSLVWQINKVPSNDPNPDPQDNGQDQNWGDSNPPSPPPW